MNTIERRERRRIALVNLATDAYIEDRMSKLDAILDELDEIDKAVNKPTEDFYDMVNVLDSMRKLLNATQGRAKNTAEVLDLVIDHCVKYSELYKKEVKL